MNGFYSREFMAAFLWMNERLIDCIMLGYVLRIEIHTHLDLPMNESQLYNSFTH